MTTKMNRYENSREHIVEYNFFLRNTYTVHGTNYIYVFTFKSILNGLT